MTSQFSNTTLNSSEAADSEILNGCRSYNGITVGVLFYSIGVLVLYALVQRRMNKHKEICYGFLGIPIPVNLIHETKDRWVYAIAFGILTGDFLSLILGGNIIRSTNIVGNILSGIVLILIMMIFPLIYFALFASIHGTIKIVSQVVGFVYVLLVFIQLILRCSDCIYVIDDIYPAGIVRNANRAVLYSQCIPTSICLILIGGFFVWRGVQAIVYLIMGKPFPPSHTVSHHIGHVKRLLSNSSPSVPSNRLFAIVQPYIYRWDPYFKFSVRIISTGTVIVLALLVLTIELVNSYIILAKLLENYIYINLGLDKDFLDPVVGLTYLFGILVPFVCYVMVIIGYMTSLSTYRRQCKLLWKGDKSFLPAKKKSTARILLSSVHFFGFQVAMAIWAWILYSIIITMLMFAILILIILMALNDSVRKWVLERLILLTSSLVTGYIIYYTQYFFIKYVFVSKNEEQKNSFWKSLKNVQDQAAAGSTPHKDKTITTAKRDNYVLVDNRRLFHMFTFFFIFYYTLIGLFKAIRRVIVTAALNLFYFSRLDTSLTIKGWEFLDKAYGSYISVLKVDATYNNPVMNVFIYLMSRVAEDKPARKAHRSSFPLSIVETITITQYYNTNGSLNAPLLTEQSNEVATSRAKKRWHLAYTLLRNPELIELRRRDHEDEDIDINKDPTKDNVKDGGKFGITLDATKL